MATDVKNDATLSTSLLHYWEVEEASGNRVDSHSTRDLTPAGTVSQDASGKQGNAVSFGTSAGDRLAASGSGIVISASDNRSFSFWIKTPASSGKRVIGS